MNFWKNGQELPRLIQGVKVIPVDQIKQVGIYTEKQVKEDVENGWSLVIIGKNHIDRQGKLAENMLLHAGSNVIIGWHYGGAAEELVVFIT